MREGRISGVEIKFDDTRRTVNGEGVLLCNNWRWETKAWVANRIRYPNSPSRQWWMSYIRYNFNV